MILYISAMDHARKLKLSSYVHLPSINKMFRYQLRLSDFVLLKRGYYFRAWALYLSFGKMLTFSSNVLLAGTNTIYKYGHAWVI